MAYDSGSAFDGNGYGNRCDVNHVNETAKVPCDADIGTTINHASVLSGRLVDSDRRVGVATKTKDSGGTHDVCDTVCERRNVGQGEVQGVVCAEVDGDRGRRVRAPETVKKAPWGAV